MGIDASRPSREYTELYFPADTFRVCNPSERCRCPGAGGRHRDSRYYYVERGGDGRERLHDPFDYMDRMMMGCGGRWPMPWKDVSLWTTRDYDKLGEVLNQYSTRVRAKQIGEWDNCMAAMMPAMMMADEMRSPPCSRRQNYRGMCSCHSRAFGRSDCREFLMDRMDRIAESYRERLAGLEDDLYGSESQRREEQYKRKQFKLFHEFMHGGMYGMNSGMGMQGMMNPNMGMGAGMMPQQYAAMGLTPQQYANMAGAQAMGGMGANGMMQGGPMGQGYGFGNEMFGGGLGEGLGRRATFGRPRRRPGLMMAEDDDDDELGDMLRTPRRRRRGTRWGREADDDIGGFDDSPTLRPDRGPKPGPRGPDGRPSAGGVVFEDEVRRNVYSRPVSRQASPQMRMPPTTVADGVNSPIRDPVGSSSSPMPGLHSRAPTTMPTAEQFMPQMTRHASGTMPGMGTYTRHLYEMDLIDPAAHMQTRMSGAMPRPSTARGVSFDLGGGLGLARPREEEENRGEPEAGGTADRRDAQPRRL